MTADELDGNQTVAAVAARMGVSTQTVGNWIRTGVVTPGGRGRLAAARLGGRWVVPAGALDAFVGALNPQGAGASPAARATPGPGAGRQTASASAEADAEEFRQLVGG